MKDKTGYFRKTQVEIGMKDKIPTFTVVVYYVLRNR